MGITQLVREALNKPDAANPAMTLWVTIESRWRRVADLKRFTYYASRASQAEVL